VWPFLSDVASILHSRQQEGDGAAHHGDGWGNSSGEEDGLVGGASASEMGRSLHSRRQEGE
jgi:hypothetical protein